MSDYIEVPVYLSVDDKTRHWTYFRANPRTEAERLESIHKTDSGGAHVQRSVRVYDGRARELSLDEASFELVECPTALSNEDFYAIQAGDQALLHQYYIFHSLQPKSYPL